MSKRSYVVFSLFLALAIGASIAVSSASVGDFQKDKDKEKGESNEKQKDKNKDVEVLSEPSFSFALAGSGTYLGVYLEEVTPSRAKELKLSEERGAVIMKVVEGSPAEKAGLKENDVIVSFNGRRVDTVRELQRLLGETPAGRNVQFEVVRGGSHQTLQATVTRRSPDVSVWNGRLDDEVMSRLQRQSEDAARRSQDALKLYQKSLEKSGKAFKDFGDFNFVAPGRFMFYRGSRLGIGVESLTDQLAQYFGVKSGHGVLVSEVKDDSPAAKAGLKAGDVITAADGEKVDDVSALMEAISKKQEGTITLTIVRNRSEQTITVTVEKPAPRVERIRRPGTRVMAYEGVSVSI